MRMLTLPGLAALLMVGCASVQEIAVHQPGDVAPPPTGTPTAGAACVDITPPPGMPMGGYSILANKGRGFRTRIKARAVYLNDGKGHSVALVQLDLAAGSLLLHHMVAETVAQSTGLRPGDIAITASHTHSAPANIFDNDFYNANMSNGKWLEPTFLAFATQRIAEAILEAHQTRRPAMIATGTKDIYGYNRNRSLRSYVLNENVGPIDVDDPEAVFQAVNPALCMVRVDVQDDGGRYRPLAAFSTFSAHATAISPPVQVYNADWFAYAQKDLEWSVERTDGAPWAVVHALATGTQGDMAPAVPDRGDNTFGHFPVNWKEAKALGQGIGGEAISLFEELGDRLTDDFVVYSAVRELNIRENTTVQDVHLCKDAVVGNTVVAGAYERRAPWLAAIPFLKGGNVMAHRWWFFKDGCQGNKRHFGGFLQPLLVPQSSFPNTVMFQLIGIGDTVIVPVPFEMTVESGRRMAARVKQEFADAGRSDVRHVWIASNANGYFGYATTPQEYACQNYEGGHTLYGRYTTPYLTAQVGLLARDLLAEGEVHELMPQWRYRLKVNTFYPKPRPATGERRALLQPTVVAARKENEEPYIRFRWEDVGPSQIDFHRPLSRVEVRRNGSWELMRAGGEPINDDGYDLEVRYLRSLAGGMGRYEVRWYNPLPGGEYRFVIEPRGECAALSSRAFVYGGSPDGQDGTIALALIGAE